MIYEKSEARKKFLKFVVILLGFGLLTMYIVDRVGLTKGYTGMEARQVSGILNAVGIQSRIRENVPGVPPELQGSIVWIPTKGGYVGGLITLSCSSLGLVAIFLILCFLTPWIPTKKKVISALIAAPILHLGNIVRLAGVFAFGHFFGLDSMIALHDWIGPILAFIYLLIAYGIWLYFVMRTRRGVYW